MIEFFFFFWEGVNLSFKMIKPKNLKGTKSFFSHLFDYRVSKKKTNLKQVFKKRQGGERETNTAWNLPTATFHR